MSNHDSIASETTTTQQAMTEERLKSIRILHAGLSGDLWSAMYDLMREMERRGSEIDRLRAERDALHLATSPAASPATQCERCAGFHGPSPDDCPRGR